MAGSLTHVWVELAQDLWEPLAEYSAADVAAPTDLFSDLFTAADEYLAPRPTGAELIEARNDPDTARQRFLALQGTDFVSESAIVLFLEEAQAVIADYEILGLEEFYGRLLREALLKFNLRYRLEEPFTLRFLLPGSFTNLYSELHRLNASNGHLAGLLTDFEKAFDRYARAQDPTDLKTCITKASNFAEGLASVAAGIPPTGNTLGVLCNRTGDWPHEDVKESLQRLYKFCCDYPGIRHGGNPSSQRRSLDIRDSVSINVSIFALAGYLCGGLDHAANLGSGTVGKGKRFNPAAPRTKVAEGRTGWMTRLFRRG